MSAIPSAHLTPKRLFIRKCWTKKWFCQQLGILYVAEYLREVGKYKPAVIDCLVEGMGIGKLKNYIKREKPDVVGFSVLTFNLLDCLDAAKDVKEVSPNTKVCFGGFHVSLYPDSLYQRGPVFMRWLMSYLYTLLMNPCLR